MLEIKSERTGKLVLWLGQTTIGTFTIRAKVAIPKEISVVITEGG